jgi:cell division protein FtsN
MSRDYKASARNGSGRVGGGGASLLTGILIGLVLGLGLALGVAWYINKMPSPFGSRIAPATPAEPAAKGVRPAPKGEEKGAAPADGKPRFDFYKILPGAEESTQPKIAPPASSVTPKEAFFLQAGAFQSAPDADNLKARLALLGIEASIESTTSADKGRLHRVRIGPYTSVEELNRTRDTLKQNGVPTTLIRVRETEQ